MPYPGTFVRLVILGDIYTDHWATSLSIVPSALGEISMPPVDAATLAGVATDVQAWWMGSGGNSGAYAQPAAKLTSIKLNRINATGHYADPVSFEHIYPTPIAGTGTGAVPAQESLAVTLRTRVPRGRGSHGRMYFPPTAHHSNVNADGRINATNAGLQATSAKLLITLLNARYTLIGRVGVASDAGSGIFEHVTSVSAGRVVDTMRSRRSSLDEDYQTVAI